MVASIEHKKVKKNQNMNTTIIDNDPQRKRHLKVLVFCNNTSTGSLSIIYDKKSKLYSGYLFELWEYVAKISNFNCEYTPLEGQLHDKNGKTYNEAVKLFSKSQYDVCIGDFSVTAKRAKIVKFTRPLMLSKIILLYKDDDDSILPWQGQFIKTFLRIVGKPLLVLIVLALVLGFVLHKSDTKQRNLYISIWGTVGAFLQEPGLTVEKTNPKNIVSVIVSFIILLSAFYFAIYLQAKATASELNKAQFQDPFKHGIKDKKIATNKGSAFVELLVEQGAIPVPLTGTQPQRIQKWFDNPNIPGIITNDSYYALNNLEDREIFVSSYNLPFDQISFMVPLKSTKIYSQINNALIIAHDNKMSTKLCHMYYSAYPALCRI